MENINDRIRIAHSPWRSKIEDILKNNVCEFVSNLVHEENYQKVKASTTPFINRQKIELELEIAIVLLRASLNNNPKERELQNLLLEFEKVARVRTASLSEVCILKPSGKSGRIDILALPDDEDDLGRIIELKRPSLKLIAYKKRPSSTFKGAIRQIGEYQESTLKFRGEELSSYRKTIVAGRKQILPEAYLIIAEEEQKNSVDVYSWDAWINRLERIYT